MAETFPAILSRLRKERGLNQRTAATALHISQALLSHYENGLREPGLAFVTEACAFYGVSADYLLGRTRVRTPIPAGEDWEPRLLALAEQGTEALFRLLSAMEKAGNPENCRLAEEWFTVQLYDLLRDCGGEGQCTLPPELSRSLCQIYTGLVRARLLSGQPGIPELALNPELAKRAEGILRKLWEDWREQV